ncbi:MAG TPA: tripartite tricarboxylate transporter substrate binding protein [Burkholderiales bacterium]|nr:tripartite tricarboxylate transporter substrate binding protein [Burkholderiales bacterium]
MSCGRFAIVLACTACVPAQCLAQAWPVKPVRIIAPFAAGGSADTLGRVVATKLGESLGQPFIVENRGGAGGLSGADAVARSAPDGYTLVVTGLGPLVIATAGAAKASYDPLRDFTHIALLGGQPSVLGVHPSLPVKDVKGFIALARQRPGTLTYGSAGIGSTGQLVAETLRRIAAIDIQHVPYKGASIAVSDIVGGHIHAISVTLTTTAAQIRAGKVRALAMTSAARVPDYPDVPTFRELGYAQLVASVWFSLSGPPGLPVDIVNRLNSEVRRILQSPEVRERLRAQAIEPGTFDAREFSEFVAAEYRRWAPMVRQVLQPGGATPQ